MTAPASECNDDPSTSTDLLEDIFGSAPPSPTALARPHHDLRPALSAGARPLRALADDPSDIPRLRSTHVTNGYREGIAAGKQGALQAGFDEGYALGAELGKAAGWVKGALEGLLAALAKDGGDGSSGASGARAELRDLLQTAERELDARVLFGSEYFGEDGVWVYGVPGQERGEEGSLEGEQITFAEVAAAHPVLRKWRSIAGETASRYGLVLD